MSDKADFYELLGVARDSSADDIRKAYRQAALKFHRIATPGNPQKKTSSARPRPTACCPTREARAVRPLRPRGSGGAGFDFNSAGMGDILSHFQDMFSDFFGGFGGGPARRRGPERGQDIRVDASIALKTR